MVFTSDYWSPFSFVYYYQLNNTNNATTTETGEFMCFCYRLSFTFIMVLKYFKYFYMRIFGLYFFVPSNSYSHSLTIPVIYITFSYSYR